MNTTPTREPAVAGRFYPGNPEPLRHEAEAYINDSQVTPAPESVAAIVTPHAGYIYSGPTAGHAYARVRGKRPKRVILIGCSHHYPIRTASVYPHGAFGCPLGTLPVDETFAQHLADETESVSTEPHAPEHTLEVQLPFILIALGETPIVPVLLGGPPRPWHAHLGEMLATMADDSDLLVASTDLSHYLSQEEANRIDKQSIDALLSGDWAAFVKGIESGTYSMCGASAVVTAMTYANARGARAWTLLDYRTSAEASGDYRRVVGYAAVSMERAA